MKSLAVSIMVALFFLISTPTVHSDDGLEENVITFSNMSELYDDIGPFKLLRLMMTPIDQRAMFYHAISLQAVKSCESPNAWYFEGLVEDDICQNMKNSGFNVVCNTACPDNRRTGIKCGLAHECCRPAESETSPETPSQEEVETSLCSSGGGGRSIQYCTF